MMVAAAWVPCRWHGLALAPTRLLQLLAAVTSVACPGFFGDGARVLLLDLPQDFANLALDCYSVLPLQYFAILGLATFGFQLLFCTPPYTMAKQVSLPQVGSLYDAWMELSDSILDFDKDGAVDDTASAGDHFHLVCECVAADEEWFPIIEETSRARLGRRDLTPATIHPVFSAGSFNTLWTDWVDREFRDDVRFRNLLIHARVFDAICLLDEDEQAIETSLSTVHSTIAAGKKFNDAKTAKLFDWLQYYGKSDNGIAVSHRKVALVLLWLSKFVFGGFPSDRILIELVRVAIKLSRGFSFPLAPLVLGTLYHQFDTFFDDEMEGGGCFLIETAVSYSLL
ncbi:hypothetical protein COLO4_06062 [Corchorus olitorius]|uniref:Aminotransferase-like plant mobile domain-containing protein n=1 Tax=Corchorus olitorius TaxID=93759 RepID=A0A1R3KP23_9ROSI|nr:hypothetical protein COLO4_06062 [Corchorus olitorius]